MSIKYFKITADNNYDFGYKLGKQIGKDIFKRYEQNQSTYIKKGVNGISSVLSLLNKFKKQIKREYPAYFSELQGISDSSEFDFNKLLFLQCEEEIIDHFIPRCTSVALKTYSGDILLGHNEDWLPTYKDNGIYVVKGIFPDNKFLAVGFIGQMCGSVCGLNNFGLSYVGNSIYVKRGTRGIPKNIILRYMMDCHTMDSVEKILLTERHIIGSNFMVVYGKSEMKDIEVLNKSICVFKNKKYLVHTNHPLLEKKQNAENTSVGSLLRFAKAKKMIAESSELSLDTIKKILKDHTTPICKHIEKDSDVYGMTIASLILNSNKKKIMVSNGPPCNNKYDTFTL